MRAGARAGNEEMLSAGLEALDWLVALQRCEVKGHFVPIGSQGFYSKTTEKARFDQQPVEACAVVSACLQAYQATGKGRWRKEAWSAFNWFLGDNDLQIALYDPTTGGCRDGSASRPGQRKSRSGVYAVVPDGTSGNASSRRKRRYGKIRSVARCNGLRNESKLRECSSMNVITIPMKPKMNQYETLFERHRRQSDFDGKGLAIFDQQRVQRRRNAFAGWFHAAALPCGGSPRAFTPVRGAFGERRG